MELNTLIFDSTVTNEDYVPYEFTTSRWGIIIIANALIGLCAFEWAWYKTYRFRKPNRELNDIFHMFARKDAVNWSKWKFYPGALTIMIPRILLGVFIAGIGVMIVAILLIGHKKN